MTGKQIAENLRQNRDKWTRMKYHDNGKYCVIGLKLHELGVEVEKWNDKKQTWSVGALLSPESEALTWEEVRNLYFLQEANDHRADGVDSLIRYAEENGDTEFAIEKLAAALKSSPSNETVTEQS